MSNPRYVTAHGKRIVVETLDMPDVPERKAKKRDAFASVPLQWMAIATKVTNTQGAMVLVLLRYTAWKAKNTTFSLSNGPLVRYGINRQTKYRILASLEKAGLIKIQRRNKQALIVTLLE